MANAICILCPLSTLVYPMYLFSFAACIHLLPAIVFVSSFVARFTRNSRFHLLRGFYYICNNHDRSRFQARIDELAKQLADLRTGIQPSITQQAYLVSSVTALRSELAAVSTVVSTEQIARLTHARLDRPVQQKEVQT